MAVVVCYDRRAWSIDERCGASFNNSSSFATAATGLKDVLQVSNMLLSCYSFFSFASSN